jgi:hypothetical protein
VLMDYLLVLHVFDCKHNRDNQVFVYCMRILTRQLSYSYYR